MLISPKFRPLRLMVPVLLLIAVMMTLITTPAGINLLKTGTTIPSDNADDKSRGGATAHGKSSDESADVSRNQKQQQQLNQKGQGNPQNANMEFTGGSPQKAAFVMMAKEDQVDAVVETVSSFQEHFNSKFKYDWVILSYESDSGLSKQFQSRVRKALLPGNTAAIFDRVDKKKWVYPDGAEETKKGRPKTPDEEALYTSGPQDLRLWTKYWAKDIFSHSALKKYKYYWRADVGGKLLCDIDYDIFQLMAQRKVDFAFTLALNKYPNEGLFEDEIWQPVKKFLMRYRKKFVPPDNLQSMITGSDATKLSHCHYWTSLEIGNMEFWRSEAFEKLFKFIEKSLVLYYYEIPEDVVHTIAVSLLMPKDRIMFLEDFSYSKGDYVNCSPRGVSEEKKCVCPSSDSITTWSEQSCLRRFYKSKGLELPEGR